jgi:hypothetical protein
MIRLFVFVSLFASCTRNLPCIDEQIIVQVFGCRDGWCEVIFDDGYIARVPNGKATLGSKICISEIQ